MSRILDSNDPSIFEVHPAAPGPSGTLPLIPADLLHRPSGDIFGMTQNAGMGWDPSSLRGKEILLLSTHGGVRRPDGTPVALGYHTGHWEVGLLVEAAAEELK
ncbi:MAG: YjhG/YagF family D-xylonate dehydratase, partial [Acidobacteria bacterium]|nr:YjhG/YagF family D-xylonate dehydratase [Acidobacteriota bacterium]